MRNSLIGFGILFLVLFVLPTEPEKQKNNAQRIENTLKYQLGDIVKFKHSRFFASKCSDTGEIQAYEQVRDKVFYVVDIGVCNKICECPNEFSVHEGAIVKVVK